MGGQAGLQSSQPFSEYIVYVYKYVYNVNTIAKAVSRFNRTLHLIRGVGCEPETEVLVHGVGRKVLTDLLQCRHPGDRQMAVL